MATEIKLPRLGQGMESGTIVKWLKSEGDKVEKGEPLYELDTDKVTQEVEADASGVLLRIAVAEGEVPVGRTIAVIGEQGEEVAEEAKAEDRPEEEGSPGPAREAERERGRAASTNGSQTESAPAERSLDTGAARLKASPLARRIARERGIDLASISGTGPEGRVVAEDVERAAAAPASAAAPAPAAAGEVEARPLTSIRRTIARRLTQAWTIPVFQLTISVDMTRTNELVTKLRAANPDVRITVSDVLAKLSAAALMKHRDVNVQYTEEAILVFPSANIGIAVAAPQGLVVPVISACERRTIPEIAIARVDVVERARAAKLQAADMEGGTFTISNLGMYGVEQFIAVLNPPQAAILAVGTTEDRIVAVDGAPAVRPMLTLTLTCDHRAVDGATGAEFLATLKASLEEPGLAL
ncbi:MAG: 2-oxo acid dehydrogenase subunit E2 [Actinobacteria bacterium]|nr:MAG: 2-oxo acid dehydrogenase subunit E2 [Actinomycetota bacterium]